MNSFNQLFDRLFYRVLNKLQGLPVIDRPISKSVYEILSDTRKMTSSEARAAFENLLSANQMLKVTKPGIDQSQLVHIAPSLQDLFSRFRRIEVASFEWDIYVDASVMSEKIESYGSFICIGYNGPEAKLLVLPNEEGVYELVKGELNAEPGNPSMQTIYHWIVFTVGVMERALAYKP